MGLLEHPEHSTLEKAKLGKLQTQLLLLSLPSKKKIQEPEVFSKYLFIVLFCLSFSPYYVTATEAFSKNTEHNQLCAC